MAYVFLASNFHKIQFVPWRRIIWVVAESLQDLRPANRCPVPGMGVFLSPQCTHQLFGTTPAPPNRWVPVGSTSNSKTGRSGKLCAHLKYYSSKPVELYLHFAIRLHGQVLTVAGQLHTRTLYDRYCSLQGSVPIWLLLQPVSATAVHLHGWNVFLFQSDVNTCIRHFSHKLTSECCTSTLWFYNLQAERDTGTLYHAAYLTRVIHALYVCVCVCVYVEWIYTYIYTHTQTQHTHVVFNVSSNLKTT
jgi:hypothetical protein